jgi:hypothetical protein
MQGNVLSIAGGIGDDFLFLRRPQYHASAEGMAVPADRVTCVRAICVVRV